MEACILVTWRQVQLLRSYNLMETPKRVLYEQVQHIVDASRGMAYE